MLTNQRKYVTDSLLIIAHFLLKEEVFKFLAQAGSNHTTNVKGGGAY